jgi:putative colanic acid biosynthesis UDP-glucose lipid carrier transferase
MNFKNYRIMPLNNAFNRAIKRIFDIVFSSIFLVTLFPVIYAVLGAIIKLSSRGPVFFVQERTGKLGETFKCYKFRSMLVNSEAHTKQATSDDIRITRIGRFMRKSNLDELPQFINVLKGEMSVVGPRPHMLLHTEEYSRLINKYMSRHLIKPGITGWAQVNGCRGELRTVEDMANRVEKDIWYSEHWNFLLDIYIILRTIACMIRGEENAY